MGRAQSPQALGLGIPQSVGIAANLQMVQNSRHESSTTCFPPPSSGLCCNTLLRKLTWPPSSWRNPLSENIPSHLRRPLSKVGKTIRHGVNRNPGSITYGFCNLGKSLKPLLNLTFLICKMELMIYSLPTF